MSDVPASPGLLTRQSACYISRHDFLERTILSTRPQPGRRTGRMPAGTARGLSGGAEPGPAGGGGGAGYWALGLVAWPGAGTGKTRVLTTRLAHLCPGRRRARVRDKILSVTFTNKVGGGA